MDTIKVIVLVSEAQCVPWWLVFRFLGSISVKYISKLKRTMLDSSPSSGSLFTGFIVFIEQESNDILPVSKIKLKLCAIVRKSNVANKRWNVIPGKVWEAIEYAGSSVSAWTVQLRSGVKSRNWKRIEKSMISGWRLFHMSENKGQRNAAFKCSTFSANMSTKYPRSSCKVPLQSQLLKLNCDPCDHIMGPGIEKSYTQESMICWHTKSRKNYTATTQFWEYWAEERRVMMMGAWSRILTVRFCHFCLFMIVGPSVRSNFGSLGRIWNLCTVWKTFKIRYKLFHAVQLFSQWIFESGS